MDQEIKKNGTCFVIMPISDSDLYESGHFKRVYDFIIKPAVIKAGFVPCRADDVKETNFIIIDILQKIVSSEMVICDISSRNPNVLYELGIRQAFNLPVTIIRDSRTDRIFDIQGLRDIEYDENLRVDNVNNSVNHIYEMLKNTYLCEKDSVNSIIQLLGIKPAKVPTKTELTYETSILLNAIKNVNDRLLMLENNNSIKEQVNLNSVAEYLNKYKSPKVTNEVLKKNRAFYNSVPNSVGGVIELGDEVCHKTFGKGTVEDIQSDGTVVVRFVDRLRRLSPDVAKMKIVEKGIK